MKRLSRKTQENLKHAGLGLGIVSVLAGLIFGLGSVVASDNNALCSELGLRGGILTTSCTPNKKYYTDYATYVVGNTQDVPTLNAADISYKSEILGYATSAQILHPEVSQRAFSVSDRLPINQAETSAEAEAVLEDSGDPLSDQISRVKNTLSSLSSALATPAQTNGADYLGAIEAAVDTLLYEREDEKEKITVIIYGSGLSDKGILDFSSEKDALLTREPKDIVSRLLEAGLLSESSEPVRNLEIVWYGIGTTVTSRPDLPNKARENLKQIYSEILKNQYGAAVKFQSIPTSGVAFDTRAVVKPAYSVPISDIFSDAGAVYEELKTSVLAFVPDSTAFIDEVAAESELAARAQEILKAPNHSSVTVYAYTAWPASASEQDMRTLSLKRAERIKSTLVAYGVDPAIITAVGEGAHPDCRRGDVGDEYRIVKLKGNLS